MFQPGDRVYVSEHDTDIDPQFKGQRGIVRSEGTASRTGHTLYDVEFDNVDPPFKERMYGHGNYWRVSESSLHRAPAFRLTELTPEGIEAFLNA